MHRMVNTVQTTPQRQDDHQEDEHAADKAARERQHALVAQRIAREQPQRQHNAYQQDDDEDDGTPHAACAKQGPRRPARQNVLDLD